MHGLFFKTIPCKKYKQVHGAFTRFYMQIECDREVTSGSFDSNSKKWRLSTTNSKNNNQTFTSDCVINAAGLYGDVVDSVLIGESSFTSVHRKVLSAPSYVPMPWIKTMLTLFVG